MKKKYLTKTSINDGKEASEFRLFDFSDKFIICMENERNPKTLEIPYSEFEYPQFIYEEAILQELKERIEERFKDECQGKAIIICYGMIEELKCNQIILKNKREFEL